MQKRVALARALITDPKIVLFDEPTTGLDPVRKNAILSMIAQYHKKFGFTAILVSHKIPDIFFISNRIKDFQKHGIRQMQAWAYKSAASMETIEFAIRAGVAQGSQGQSTVELESIIALAKPDQKEIARLRCDAQAQAN